ncbi:hypothetical protein ACRAWD_10935 [Caulobacter segnis]
MSWACPPQPTHRLPDPQRPALPADLEAIALQGKMRDHRGRRRPQHPPAAAERPASIHWGVHRSPDPQGTPDMIEAAQAADRGLDPGRPGDLAHHPDPGGRQDPRGRPAGSPPDRRGARTIGKVALEGFT